MKTKLFDQDAQSSSLARKYGYEEWMVSRFIRYAPDVQGFLEKMEKKPKQYIRVNTLKTQKSALKQSLTSKGFELSDTFIEDVLEVVKSPFSAGATTEYLLGHYYIQDISSCVPVEVMELGENQTVLDMAAAPGGKTTYIAQKLNNTGLVVALEPNGARIKSMVFNLARCGVANTCIYKISGEQAEEEVAIKFDRILLDAPCSCEGVIARDVKRKTSHKPQDVDFCSSRQQELIAAAARMVKPGGILVYSTCSFAPEENEAVIDNLIDEMEKNEGIRVEIEPIEYGKEGMTSFGDVTFRPNLKNTRRFYPHIHDTIGFFVAKLRIG